MDAGLLLLAVVAFGVPGPTPAPAPTAAAPGTSSSHFAIEQVGPGVFAAIASLSDTVCLGNAGFVVGDDGVLVVDACATTEGANELLAAIRETTPLPVRFLVDSHHHADHSGGNAVFRRAGAVVIARKNARERILADDAPGPVDPRRLPEVTYEDALTLWLGERRVEVSGRPGHSAGDSLVKVPDAHVVFTGDLVSKNAVPNLADSSLSAWIETLDRLLVDERGTTFVPGHGGVARPLDVRFFRDFLVGLRLSVARAEADGKSGDALVAAVHGDLARRYARWTWFEHVDEAIREAEKQSAGTTASPAAPRH